MGYLNLTQIHTQAHRDYVWRERQLKLNPDSLVKNGQSSLPCRVKEIKAGAENYVGGARRAPLEIIDDHYGIQGAK
jgi:hypothetical protein